ncbi:MAG: hypothetical protein GQ534_06610 [Candidatus Delongbacteria bacterium]|nr:hypothetical protein [Candidatus Delongbacteria bacterium]
MSSQSIETPRSESFSDIARKVIKNSIRSAVCIDDEYPSAYQIDVKLKTSEAKRLYDSFRSVGNCDLDIYNFDPAGSSWNKEFMIPNKDLIILDWELDKDAVDEKFIPTLEILEDITHSEQVPFVVIYTHTEAIDDVAKKLLETYSYIPQNIDDLKQSLVNILKEFDSSLDGQNLIDLIEDEKLKQISYEYIHFIDKRDESKKRIIENFNRILEIKVEEKVLERKLKKVFNDYHYISTDNFELLSIAIFNLESKYTGEYPIRRLESKSFLYKIGYTTIYICRKEKVGGIKPEDLFNEFSKAIIANPHNYLSLLSLELKDQLKTEFSKIGSRFAEIDEKSFFYHVKNLKNKTEDKLDLNRIKEFILRSWLEDFSSLRTEITSEVIQNIEEVSKQKDTPNDLSPEVAISLIKYSALLSTNNSKKKNRKLRFGDIFIDDETKEYFICITPHCNCLRPDKIDSNFYFIKGVIAKKNTTAIQNAEKGYYSFLDINDEQKSIEWTTVPFTMYVLNNDIDNLSCCFMQKKYELKFCTSLKENFTQRLSNKSFGYGYTVGIDLPHWV